MFATDQASPLLRKLLASLLTLTIVLGPSIPPALAAPAKPISKKATRSNTATPIQYLVVIFQENVSFDHYFGTYPNALNPPFENKFKASAKTPVDSGHSDRSRNND